MEKKITRLKFESIEVPEVWLIKIWKSLAKSSTYPHGKIKAYVLENEEFERVCSDINKSPNIKLQSLFEYGVQFPDLGEEIEAFVTGDHKQGFFILVKKDGHCSVEYNLKHELRHIVKGEVKIYSENNKDVGVVKMFNEES